AWHLRRPHVQERVVAAHGRRAVAQRPQQIIVERSGVAVVEIVAVRRIPRHDVQEEHDPVAALLLQLLEAAYRPEPARSAWRTFEIGHHRSAGALPGAAPGVLEL